MLRRSHSYFQFEIDLYKMAYIYVGNEVDALDVVQEVAYRSFKYIHSLQSSFHIKTWLIRIAINCATDLLKKRGQFLPYEMEEIEQGEEPHEELPQKWVIEDIITRLSKEEKDVIVLRFYNDYTLLQVSQALQLKIRNNKNNLVSCIKETKTSAGTGGTRMSDFKKQMEQIDIPKSLHKRSLQGIERVSKEQQKPKLWLPKIITIAMTLAAVGFIALSIEQGEKNNHQASSILVQEYSSSYIYWGIAILCLFIILVVTKRKIGSGADKVKTLGITVILILLLGNSAFFLQHQLVNPLVIPTLIEVNKDEQNGIEIRYITNHNDYRYVKFLQTDNVILPVAYFTLKQDNLINGFYYPHDAYQTLRYQYIRDAYFQADLSVIEKIIASKDVYLILSDDVKIKAPLSLIYQNDNQIPHQSFRASRDQDEQVISFILEQDAEFDDFYVPSFLESHVILKEFKVNNQPFTSEDFPISLKKGQRIELFIQFKNSPFDMNASVGLSGPDGYLITKVFSKTYFTESMVKKVREMNE